MNTVCTRSNTVQGQIRSIKTQDAIWWFNISPLWSHIVHLIGITGVRVSAIKGLVPQFCDL